MTGGVKALRELLLRFPETERKISEYESTGSDEEQLQRKSIVTEALTYIDAHTFQRINEELEEDVLMICAQTLEAMVDEMEKFRGVEQRKGVQSETLGGWSRSYASGGQLEQERQRKIRYTFMISMFAAQELTYSGM